MPLTKQAYTSCPVGRKGPEPSFFRQSLPTRRPPGTDNAGAEGRAARAARSCHGEKPTAPPVAQREPESNSAGNAPPLRPATQTVRPATPGTVESIATPSTALTRRTDARWSGAAKIRSSEPICSEWRTAQGQCVGAKAQRVTGTWRAKWRAPVSHGLFRLIRRPRRGCPIPEGRERGEV